MGFLLRSVTSIPSDICFMKDMKHELLKDFDSPFVYGEDLYPEFE